MGYIMEKLSIIIIFSFLNVFSQQLVFETNDSIVGAYHFEPFIEHKQPLLMAFKNNSDVKIVNVETKKIESSFFVDIKDSTILFSIYISRFWFDSDKGIEKIVTYYNSNGSRYFDVLDDNGSKILSDTGIASFYGTYNTTYLYTSNLNSTKVWKFRTLDLKKNNVKFFHPQNFNFIQKNNRIKIILFKKNQKMNFKIITLSGRVIINKTFSNSISLDFNNFSNSIYITKFKLDNSGLIQKMNYID